MLRRAKPAERFGRKVFLAPVLARVPAATLLRLHREGRVVLTGADLVQAMDPDLVRRSLIAAHGAEYHFIELPETTMRPNRAQPKPISGTAYETKQHWQESSDDDWDTGIYSPTGDERYVGVRTIDGSRVNVWRHHNEYIAQLEHMTRNASTTGGDLADATEFTRRRGLPGATVRYVHGGRNSMDVVLSAQGIELGTKTEISKRGKVVSVLYTLPSLDRYNALMALPVRRNPGLPRPRPKVDTSLSRVSRLERAQRQQERPFDPEARYPRETKPHHFSLNPGSSTMEPFREPDVEVDLSWAVWYGPDGEQGDSAVEVDHQVDGFTVREYESVVGYFDEGTYDESTPFRMLETRISGDEMEKLAVSNQALYDAMNESEDPDEAELSIVPDDDAARLLILRYAAAFGVRYIQEHGASEESFAAELPR